MPYSKLERRPHTYRIDPYIGQAMRKQAFDEGIKINHLVEKIFCDYLKSRNQEIKRIPN